MRPEDALITWARHTYRDHGPYWLEAAIADFECVARGGTVGRWDC